MKNIPNKEPKANCFAYDETKHECRALSELACAYKDKCAFYKHKSELDWKELERATRTYSK